MNNDKQPLDPGAGCAVAFCLVLLSFLFSLLWLGVMMGDGPPGVHVDRSMAVVYLLLVLACWSGAIAAVIRGFSEKK